MTSKHHQIIFFFLVVFASRFQQFATDRSPRYLEPQFVGVLPNITVVAGSNVTLNCVVDSLGNYKIAWIHMDRHELLTIKDRLITRNSKYKITYNNFRNWSLEILNISHLESGHYMCQVNTSPMKRLVGIIQVVDPPSTDSEPQFVGVLPNITAVAGSNVTLNCVVDSLGSYKVVWLHMERHNLLTINDNVITPNSRFRITHNNVSNWSLEILNISEADSGHYICHVNTSPIKDLVGIVQVVDTPIISIESQSVGATIGSNISLDCNLESNPRSVVYWTLAGNGTMIVSGTKYNIQLIDTSIYKALMRLVIKNLRPEDFGSYKCIAKNSKGEAEGTIRLYEVSKTFSSADSSIGSQASNTDKGQATGGKWIGITLATIVLHLLSSL